MSINVAIVEHRMEIPQRFKTELRYGRRVSVLLTYPKTMTLET